MDGRPEKLGGNARSRAETEGHGCVLELSLVEHEAEVAAVGRADRLLHEEVGDVDLCHHILAADEGAAPPSRSARIRCACWAHRDRSTHAPCRCSSLEHGRRSSCGRPLCPLEAPGPHQCRSDVAGIGCMPRSRRGRGTGLSRTGGCPDGSDVDPIERDAVLEDVLVPGCHGACEEQ